MPKQPLVLLSETMIYVLMAFTQGPMCGADAAAFIHQHIEHGLGEKDERLFRQGASPPFRGISENFGFVLQFLQCQYRDMISSNDIVAGGKGRCQSIFAHKRILLCGFRKLSSGARSSRLTAEAPPVPGAGPEQRWKAAVLRGRANDLNNCNEYIYKRTLKIA